MLNWGVLNNGNPVLTIRPDRGFPTSLMLVCMAAPKA
jgi:hypothetical protein